VEQIKQNRADVLGWAERDPEPLLPPFQKHRGDEEEQDEIAGKFGGISQDDAVQFIRMLFGS
jgi:hypothetical protein